MEVHSMLATHAYLYEQGMDTSRERVGDYVFNLNFSSKIKATATTCFSNLMSNYGFNYEKG